MTTSMDILSTLDRLSEADRDWIIENLPAQAKSQLLSVPSSSDSDSLLVSDSVGSSVSTPMVGGPETSSQQPEGAFQVLADVNPGWLADLLKAEPAWLTVAVLRSREWAWRSELMDALPVGLRTEVARMADSDMSFAPQLTTTVVSLVAARLNGHTVPRTMSRFEALVEKLAATRSKRRWSIHL